MTKLLLWLFSWRASKTPRDVLIEQRDEALFNLAECRKNAEFYAAMATMYSARVERLNHELRGPVPAITLRSEPAVPGRIVELPGEAR